MAYLQARAKQAAIGDRRCEGRPIGSSGTYNVRPKFSPDGKQLAWLSNGDSDLGVGEWILDPYRLRGFDIDHILFLLEQLALSHSFTVNSASTAPSLVVSRVSSCCAWRSLSISFAITSF